MPMCWTGEKRRMQKNQRKWPDSFLFRGALIPRELAISALTFVRRVDAVSDSSDIAAEIFEGFDSASRGDLLNPVLSYWTFIVDDPQNDLVNDLVPAEPLGPTITP